MLWQSFSKKPTPKTPADGAGRWEGENGRKPLPSARSGATAEETKEADGKKGGTRNPELTTGGNAEAMSEAISL
jgi:hypothetical protein